MRPLLFMAWTTTKFSGSGALAVTFESDVGFMLEQIRVTLNVAASTAEDFTCVLDSADGSQYDVQVITHPMSGVKSFICPFGKEFKFEKGDKFVFAWDNSDSRTWGLEIRTMRLC